MPNLFIFLFFFCITNIYAQKKYKTIDSETKEVISNVTITTNDRQIYYTNTDGEVLIPEHVTTFTVTSALYESYLVNSNQKETIIELNPKVKEIAEVIISKKYSLYQITQSVMENYDKLYYSEPVIYNAKLMQKTYFDNKINHLFIADIDLWEKDGSYKLGLSGAMANPKKFLQISFDKIKYFRTKMVDKSLGNDVQFRTFNRLLFFNFNLAFAFKYTNENSYTSTYEKISNDELLIKFKSGYLEKQKAAITGELIYNTQTKAITYLKWTADQNLEGNTKSSSKVHSSQFSSEFQLSRYQDKYIPNVLQYASGGYITDEKNIKMHTYSAEGSVQFGKLTPSTDKGLDNALDLTKPLTSNIQSNVSNLSEVLLSKEEQKFIDE